MLVLQRRGVNPKLDIAALAVAIIGLRINAEARAILPFDVQPITKPS